MSFSVEEMYWMNEPENKEVSNERIMISPASETDFWKRTFYGFQVCNAPALLKQMGEEDFTYVAKVEFESKHLFDQCGMFIYMDDDNWAKLSIEYEGEAGQKLGSVVTNLGYSDWATVDIPASIKSMYYRVSRRGNDICFENSEDGKNYHQMRIFHLLFEEKSLQAGFYACSPVEGGFTAVFSEIEFTACQWKEHSE